MGEPCAYTQTVAVHRVKPGFNIPKQGCMHRSRVPAGMAVKVLAIVIQCVVMADVLHFADAHVHAPIGSITVVIHTITIISVVVRACPADPQAAFIIQPVIIGLLRNDAYAPVMGFAVCLGTVVLVAVVPAMAVFQHRAHQQLTALILQFPGKAQGQTDAFRVHVGTGLRPQAGDAHCREGSITPCPLCCRASPSGLFRRCRVRSIAHALPRQQIGARVDLGRYRHPGFCRGLTTFLIRGYLSSGDSSHNGIGVFLADAQFVIGICRNVFRHRH